MSFQSDPDTTSKPYTFEQIDMVMSHYLIRALYKVDVNLEDGFVGGEVVHTGLVVGDGV